MSVQAKSITLLLAAWVLGACGGSGSGGRDVTLPIEPPISDNRDPLSEKASVEQAALSPVASCSAYLDFLAKAMHTELTNPDQCFANFCVATTTFGGEAGVPDAVSTTNYQDENVAEADILKTASDGTVFALRNDQLNIVSAFPPDAMRELSAITPMPDTGAFTSRPIEMLYDEARETIAVIHSKFNGGLNQSTTYVSFVDVSNRNRPVIVRSMEIDGYPVGARRIDGRLHILTSRYLNWPETWFTDANETLRQTWREAVNNNETDNAAILSARLRSAMRDALGAAGVNDYLPILRSGEGAVPGNTARLGCNEIHAPSVRVGSLDLTTMTSVDSDGRNAQATAIVSGGPELYASSEAAYLAVSSRSWWLNSRIAQAQQTAIYKVTLSAGKPRYAGVGLVDGEIYDALAMDEFAGYLRITTTERRFDPVTQEFSAGTHLFVLDASGPELSEVGAVRNFELDESIFAARFMGDKGYVVTFRQIDPLFSFDLSDPANPRVVGELEMPGFSNYIHPLGDDHLLTLGRDGTLDGNIGELALRIFDVSDLASPQLRHTYVFDPSDNRFGDYSPAVHEHRAFNYDPASAVLSLPFSAYPDTGNPDDSFNGFIYFGIDTAGGITRIGEVNHNPLVIEQCLQSGAEFCGALNEIAFSPARPLRSIFMRSGSNNYIYSHSGVGLIATPANDPQNQLSRVIYGF